MEVSTHMALVNFLLREGKKNKQMIPQLKMGFEIEVKDGFYLVSR